MQVAPAGSAVASLCALLLTAGCLATPEFAVPEAASKQSVPSWPVVALLDTGINPWHQAFALEGESPPLPPVASETVPASFRRTLEEQGLEAWNSLEKGRLYWFEGTRVLAISMITEVPPELDPLLDPDPHAVYDDRNHGTGTASIVANVTSHAWILMIETDEHYFGALQWVPEQAWIDVLSMSVGNVGHTPDNTTDGPDLWAQALAKAVERGKLVVLAGGNFPDPNLLSTSGAPWVISVGAAEGDRHGLSPLTSQPVDVVANFTWVATASNDSDTDTYIGKGTSFGTPAVAGVLAEALYQTRQFYAHTGNDTADGLVNGSGVVLTNRDFRWALNMSARYWNTTDWDPTVFSTASGPFGSVYEVTNPALPAVAGTPVGPWVQMGWGFVDASTSGSMVGLLTGQAAPPQKRDATAYMEALFGIRSAVWDLYQSRP